MPIRNLNKLVASLMVAAMFAAAFFSTGLTAKAANTGTSGGSVTLTAGVLSISPAASFQYTGFTLDGTAHTLASSFDVGVTDPTGSAAGWNIQISGAAMSTTGAKTIPGVNHTVTSVGKVTVTGTAPVDSTNSYSTPKAFPTTGVKFYSADAGTGMGQSTLTFNTQLIVPADAYAGDYSTTLTVSIVTGP